MSDAAHFGAGELTCDAFLGGRLRLNQPSNGYRAGIDPVLLAASVPAREGQEVLDLGCGAGAAALCLHARVPGLILAGVELQPEYAALARSNAEAAQADMQVFRADIADLPGGLRQRQFDHVIANPPYFRTGARSPSPDAGREMARAEDTDLAAWADCAARRSKPGGHVHMVQSIARLPEMLAAFRGRLGSIEALPIAAREGRSPHLVILRARKGGRADFVLHTALILHSGTEHQRDGDSYRAEITEILRNGAPLPWPARGRRIRESLPD